MVEEYYKTQGGRPEKPAPAPRKRKSMGEGKASQKHTEPKKQRKPSSQPEEDDGMDNEHWVPSKGKNWENEVALVDTVMKDDKIGGLCGYVHWKNGRKSKVAIETCKEKFPRKVSGLQTYTVCCVMPLTPDAFLVMRLLRATSVSLSCPRLIIMDSNCLQVFSRSEGMSIVIATVSYGANCWKGYADRALLTLAFYERSGLWKPGTSYKHILCINCSFLSCLLRSVCYVQAPYCFLRWFISDLKLWE